LYLDEFWFFLEQFEKWAKDEKRGSRSSRKESKYFPKDGNPMAWLKDPQYKAAK